MIRDVRDLGIELKCARTSQKRSLREVARLVGTSHSTIDRLERGRLAADQTVVAALDELYRAGGHFADTYGQFLHPEWDGAARLLIDQHAQHSVQHVFPGEHTGDVWILLRPAKEAASRRHAVLLNWGPFSRVIDIESLPAQGVTLVTGKNAEDQVPLRVTISPDAHLLFGIDDGQIDLHDAVSIHEGWDDEEAPDGTSMTTWMLLEAIRRAATSPDATTAERHRLRVAYQALNGLNPEVARHIGDDVIAALRASRR